MKRNFTLLGLAIMMAISTSLMLQGCNNEASADQQAAQAAERAAQAAEEAAKSAKEAAQSVQQSQVASTGTVEFIGPIAWNSDDWDSDLKNEVQELAKVTEYGRLAYAPEGEITRIVKSLEINGIYSSAPTQTVIWYEYRTPEGKELDANGFPLASKILIQGSWKDEEIEDMRTILNQQRKCCKSKNNCSILLGGCFSEVKGCKPVQNDCKEQPKCIPCENDQGASPGKKQGDGVAPQASSNGTNRKISVGWGHKASL